jgi:hypothetical protein
MDVIRAADWVIDMGPEGGEAGGRIVSEGTPETIAAAENSRTARFCRPGESARRTFLQNEAGRRKRPLRAFYKTKPTGDSVRSRLLQNEAGRRKRLSHVLQNEAGRRKCLSHLLQNEAGTAKAWMRLIRQVSLLPTRDGITASHQDRTLLVERDRFRPPVEDIHRFLLSGRVETQLSQGCAGARCGRPDLCTSIPGGLGTSGFRSGR